MVASVASDAVERFLAERQDELIDFVCELVATPSPNPPGDEQAVAEAVTARLGGLGIDDVVVPCCEPGRPNVLARVPGQGGGPTLMLAGHLDTKPPGELSSWVTPPWEPVIADGMLVGLGSADMKGAIAAMVYAAAAVAEASVPGTLALAFTADEEAGGAHGARWLSDRGLLAADVCVIGEPSGIHGEWEAIRLVSRGVAIVAIEIHGTQMHSSLADELPSVNASAELARLMARMDEERGSILTFDPHALVPSGPTLNVGLSVSSGVGPGVLPGAAEFVSDIRAVPGMTSHGIVADLERFLRRATDIRPELDARLRLETWTPPCELPPDHPIVGALSRAAERVLGLAPPPGAFPGGTDAPFFQLGAGIPTVPSFGPGQLTAAHAPNESIRIESVLEAARVYALTALHYLDGRSHG